MNWGYKLLFVFIAFGAMMSYMVYRCMQTPVDLVEKEYYRDELAYQDKIDGASRANQLSSGVKLIQGAGRLVLQFPEEMKSAPVQGNILFYCASNSRNDRKISLDLRGGIEQSLRKNEINPGKYTVKIDWECQSVHYYTEIPLTIT
jgi:hypothetical protein